MSTTWTFASLVRMVLSASRCASLAWAVRITNSRTPAPSSQDSISSFMTRCSVRWRNAASPGKGREIACTPYSIVGALSTLKVAERSSARRPTMIVSQPSGRWGPCCSVVPTGTISVGRWRSSSPIATGFISLIRRGRPG